MRACGMSATYIFSGWGSRLGVGVRIYKVPVPYIASHAKTKRSKATATQISKQTERRPHRHTERQKRGKAAVLSVCKAAHKQADSGSAGKPKTSDNLTI